MENYFKIGEISKLYGIGVDSLRYYEKIGILNPVRSESGYRYYSIRDIWKLNTIRDLRGLGFGMAQIRDYLQNHTVDTTLSLLQKEQTAIGEKIQALEALRDNVTRRMDTIRQAQSLPTEVIRLETYRERKCYAIDEGYSEEHEMDVLIKRLMNLDRDRLYVVGSNQIGTVIPRETVLETGETPYEAVFVIDGRGDYTLPGGTYLTVRYRGDYGQTGPWIQKLLRYAGEHRLRLRGDFLELLWIDIHTSDDVSEHLTEIQILADTP